MNYKDLIFSSYQIIIDDDYINISKFKKRFATDEKFTKHISELNYDFYSYFRQNYFILYIEYGKPNPRPEEVVNTDTGEKENNPRQSNQYEPEQCFALLDFNNSIMWLSNGSKKSVILSFLNENFNESTIVIKDIYDEEEFLKNIKILENLKISVLPNRLFVDTNTLSKALLENIYGYEADYATLSLSYNKKKNLKNLKSKLRQILSHKEAFKAITISGRDENNLSMLFNDKIITKKIKIKAEIDNNEVFNKDSVFAELINKIENNEE
ncbi:MAG: hypothetical protein JXR48_00750 [Candidatus Delongbacteria bacterium]|nr:hypothetical protein [Candidatus Delongbacteria bacterium]MBN2833471.1 hypothetical protein [Candidatus Delongbacteria bacterium]